MSSPQWITDALADLDSIDEASELGYRTEATNYRVDLPTEQQRRLLTLLAEAHQALVTVRNDPETGGWGPDITMQPILDAAIRSLEAGLTPEEVK